MRSRFGILSDMEGTGNEGDDLGAHENWDITFNIQGQRSVEGNTYYAKESFKMKHGLKNGNKFKAQSQMGNRHSNESIKKKPMNMNVNILKRPISEQKAHGHATSNAPDMNNFRNMAQGVIISDSSLD